MKSKFIKFLQYISIAIIVGVLFWFIFQPSFANNSGFENTTTWDRIELLGIPIVLALGAFYLERSERITERKIAEDHQQDVALKTYFDRMTELMLKYDLRNTKFSKSQICRSNG